MSFNNTMPNVKEMIFTCCRAENIASIRHVTTNRPITIRINASYITILCLHCISRPVQNGDAPHRPPRRPAPRPGIVDAGSNSSAVNSAQTNGTPPPLPSRNSMPVIPVIPPPPTNGPRRALSQSATSKSSTPRQQRNTPSGMLYQMSYTCTTLQNSAVNCHLRKRLNVVRNVILFVIKHDIGFKLHIQ